jgi:hypothetical protein
MSPTIKNALIPDMFRIVAQLLDTTSALQLRNTCRQFSDLDQNAHSGYLEMIEYRGEMRVMSIPIRASYARCIRPRRIVLDEKGAYKRMRRLQEMLVRVEHVSFCYIVEGRISREWWPPRTSSINYQRRAEPLSWPDNLKSLAYVNDGTVRSRSHLFQMFPESLTTLTIRAAHHGGWEGSTIFHLGDEELREVARLDHLINLTQLNLECNSEYKEQLPKLPASLQILYTGTLTHPIKRGSLPPSLRELITGDLHCGIEDGALPDGLTHLTVGAMKDDIEYMQWHFPRSLIYLKLQGEKGGHGCCINAFIATLPDSIETLHITDHVPVFRVNKWPASLRELHVKTVTIIWFLPSRQQEVKKRQSELEFAPFPYTFQTLYVSNTIRPAVRTGYIPSHSELHAYHFADGERSVTLDCFGDDAIDVHRLLQ